jgi:cytochrome P450
MATVRPRANLLLGFAPELRRDQLRTYENVMRRYGDVVCLPVGPPGLRFELYCVFHPDGVQRVLSYREGYSKAYRGYREIAAVFGESLLTREGSPWLRQRRLVQPLFPAGRSRGTRPSWLPRRPGWPNAGRASRPATRSMRMPR